MEQQTPKEKAEQPKTIKIHTGLYDDKKNPIYLGDTLRSKHGYDVIVVECSVRKSVYVGKLICDDNDSCKDIPYALNNGEGYEKYENK